jgi:hypothetical protein
MIWANLLHLSTNMWCDNDRPDLPTPHWSAKPYMRFDEELWREVTTTTAQAGLNMVLIDLGDAIQYESHPEIAIKGAWTRQHLLKELTRLRLLGLEPIPKLNFSTAHDAWLGDYSRMVSSPTYYEVCRDLIAEVSELFGHPRFFHIGMDEELASEQKLYEYALVRQGDLWWRDLYFYVDEVEKHGARAWIWSDSIWHHAETFLKKMPRSVVQSNWYYGDQFEQEPSASDDGIWREGTNSMHTVPVNSYRILEKGGFDQIPTGSNWCLPSNFELTVDYCRNNIDPERLLGFMTAPWQLTLPEGRPRHLEAIDQVRHVIASYALSVTDAEGTVARVHTYES